MALLIVVVSYGAIIRYILVLKANLANPTGWTWYSGVSYEVAFILMILVELTLLYYSWIPYDSLSKARLAKHMFKERTNVAETTRLSMELSSMAVEAEKKAAEQEQRRISTTEEVADDVDDDDDEYISSLMVEEEEGEEDDDKVVVVVEANGAERTPKLQLNEA